MWFHLINFLNNKHGNPVSFNQSNFRDYRIFNLLVYLPYNTHGWVFLMLSQKVLEEVSKLNIFYSIPSDYFCWFQTLNAKFLSKTKIIDLMESYKYFQFVFFLHVLVHTRVVSSCVTTFFCIYRSCSFSTKH